MSDLFRGTNPKRIREALIRSFINMEKGQRLPSEPALAKAYSVSRATIREVLTHLEFEGYIIRKKGSGTYLLTPPVSEAENLLYFIDIPTMIEAKGFVSSCAPVQVHRTPAGPYFSAILDVPPEQEIIRRHLPFYASGTFAVLLEDCFPSALLSTEDSRNYIYNPEIDLRKLFFRMTGRISNRDDLSFSIADQEKTALLEGRFTLPDKTLLYMQSICYDEKNRPLMCTQFFSDTTYIDYKINRHLLFK